MSIAAHKLLRTVGGRTYFAEVTVAVEALPTTEVTVAPDAFAWLKSEQHGPDARAGSAYDDYRAGAVFGVEYALAHLVQPCVPSRIRVTRIRTSPVDTDRDAVAAAACYATWRALGDDGRDHPAFGANGISFDIRTPPK